jgi:hypothetical protein
MDPFIEGSPDWPDFHQSLTVALKKDLARAVPERYIVRGDYRTSLEMVEPEGKARADFYPDISVQERGAGRPARKKAGAAPAAVAPLRLRAKVEEDFRESFIEILERKDRRRLVTLVEVLSPSNKTPGSSSWAAYSGKRQAALLGGVNLVELDLLRNGERMPMLDPWPDSPYVLTVARAGGRGRCDVWPASAGEPLPAIPFPLCPPDADIVLPLQPLIDEIYQELKYHLELDYRRRIKLTDAEKAFLPAARRPRK